MFVYQGKESCYRLSLKNTNLRRGSPRVSAVIVTFNNAMMLRELICDLFSQTYPPDHIIVVDNASDDNTPQVMRNNFPGVKYMRLRENTGSAGGYYEGIKAALENSDLIWTLDDDVRLRDNSLEELLNGLEGLGSVGKVGIVRSVGRTHPHSFPTELEICPWRGSLIRADAIREVGLPSKEFFIYGEDLEYSLRLKKNGFKCFWIPSSKCIEVREGKTNDTLFGKTVRIYPSNFRLYYAFRNEFNIYFKYRCLIKFARTLFYALKVILYILLAERLKKPDKLSAIMVAFIDGIRGNLGKSVKYLPKEEIIQ